MQGFKDPINWSVMRLELTIDRVNGDVEKISETIISIIEDFPEFDTGKFEFIPRIIVESVKIPRSGKIHLLNELDDLGITYRYSSADVYLELRDRAMLDVLLHMGLRLVPNDCLSFVSDEELEFLIFIISRLRFQPIGWKCHLVRMALVREQKKVLSYLLEFLGWKEQLKAAKSNIILPAVIGCNNINMLEFVKPFVNLEKHFDANLYIAINEERWNVIPWLIKNMPENAHIERRTCRLLMRVVKKKHVEMLNVLIPIIIKKGQVPILIARCVRDKWIEGFISLVPHVSDSFTRDMLKKRTKKPRDPILMKMHKLLETTQ